MLSHSFSLTSRSLCLSFCLPLYVYFGQMCESTYVRINICANQHIYYVYNQPFYFSKRRLCILQQQVPLFYTTR